MNCNEPIESKQFMSDKSIRQVTIGQGAQHIGDWAFAKCTNLESVTFEYDFRPGVFGRDVFKGCEKLSYIAFADTDEETARLLALAANKLPYDHLIRSDDIGQKSWFEKWDISLATRLKSDDAEAKMSAALCGEEDISYDDIGSVDGEMSGENEEYLHREAYRKCSLCYIRLMNGRFLSDETRKLIEEFIIANRFGEGNGYAFSAIFEECGGSLDHLRWYLDIVRPDRPTLLAMISSLPAREVAAKSYLIKESDANDLLSDMML